MGDWRDLLAILGAAAVLLLALAAFLFVARLAPADYI